MKRGDRSGRLSRRIVAAAVLGLVALWPVVLASGASIEGRPPLTLDQAVPAGQNPAAQLVNVKVNGHGQTGFDVVLTGDGALPYQVFTLQHPDRIVFDLPGVTAATSRTRYEVSDVGLVRVRVGQFQTSPEPMARVVMELTGTMSWTARQDGANVRIRVAPDSASLIAQAPSTNVPTFAPGTAEEDSVPVPQEPSVAPTQVASAAPESLPVPTAAQPEKPSRPEPKTASTTTSDGDRPSAQPASITSPNSDHASAPTPTPAATKPSTFDAPTQADSFAAPSTTPTPTSLTTPTATSGQPLSGPVFAPAALDEKPAPKLAGAVPLPNTSTRAFEDGRRTFSGRPVTLNLVDADIKQVFSVFHDLSGLNFVLDPAISGAVTIVVDNVPWDQALDLILKNNSLDMVLEGNVVRIAPVTKLAQEAQARKALLEAKELEAAPVSITRTLSYAKGRDIEKVIKDAVLSPKGRVITDERTNTLILRDIPSRIDSIDRLLSTLDAETPQVMIEARIVEISRDWVRDLGINWGFTANADPALGTQTNLQFPHRARVDYDLKLPKNAGVSSLGFSFGNVLDSFTLDVTLDALETEGYAKRLSSPKIATQNNARAEIEQGVRFPIATTTATEINVTFVTAALRLQVTPQITAEGTIVLDLEVENNTPDFVNAAGRVPALNTQRAQTKVLIPDGGTTVIGGIYSVNEGTSTSGVPWLKNIPGLGWLFKSQNKQIRNRELLIFVTPRIIKAS